MRCFIAIDIDRDTQIGIAGIQRDLQNKIKLRDGGIKWVRPEQMHLTLKFLGDIDSTRVGDICNAAEKACKGLNENEFDISFSKLGCFGKPMKVIWAGMENKSQKLTDLQVAIESELEKVGFEKDKKDFAAHLTLGRVKGTPDRKTKDLIYNYGPLKMPTIKISDVCVYKSELTPEMVIYTCLKKIKLY